MKTKSFIIVITAILFTACTPAVPTQEIEVHDDVVTATSTAKVTMTPEFTATLEPIATNTATIPPTVTPTRTPLSCPTLLTPADGASLPAMGMITFSWDPVDKAAYYVLDILLPSGETVSFETKQTFREQYMEAFPASGNYQWSVSAISQDRKRSEICSSALAIFSKPFYDQPRQPSNNDRKKH